MIEDVDIVADAIKAALKSVDIRVYSDPAATVDRFPAGIVGAPVLSLEGISSTPTRAVFPTAIMVANDKTALSKLLKVVPQAIEAIRDQVEDAEISEEVIPAAILIGNTELPGYMILVEV